MHKSLCIHYAKTARWHARRSDFNRVFVVTKIVNISKRSLLRVGFVPLTDCAPIVMAQELGLFRRYGLKVALSRGLGWAAVRDELIYGELDAAHALAAMPLAASLGLGSIRCESLTGLVLSHHGNGLTISKRLHQRGVIDGHTLRGEISRLGRERLLTFGVVARLSSHRHIFRKWLKAHGIDPERDVRIVIVPPPQMVANLKAGHLDGYCVGEPWNSAAMAERAGACIATSSTMDPGHPEKVLMVRESFAGQQRDEHLALVAAILQAAEWCATEENHEELITTLARPEFVGVAADILRAGVRNFCIFGGSGVNEPSGEKAAWTLELIRQSGLSAATTTLNFAVARRAFRSEIFSQATSLLHVTAYSRTPDKHEIESVLT